MTSRTLLTSITLVLAALAGVLVLVTLPSVLSGAFILGAASLALATVALLGVIRSVTARPRGSAGVWLGAAPIPVAMLWAAGALVQTMTAAFWSWKLALAVEALGAGATAIVTLLASAAAGAAVREEQDEAEQREAAQRVRTAAERLLAVSRTSAERPRIEAVTTRLLQAPRAAYADPLEADAVETELERLTRAVPSGSAAEVELRLRELESVSVLRRG